MSDILLNSLPVLNTLPLLLIGLLVFFKVGVNILKYLWPDVSSNKHTSDTQSFEEKTYNSKTKPNEAILSLIIPAYNEEDRLPVMLDKTLDFLSSNHGNVSNLAMSAHRLSCSVHKNQDHDSDGDKSSLIEILVVNDGSTDKTSDVVRKYAAAHHGNSNRSKEHVRIRLIEMKENSGKGAAIRAGMLKSNGNINLMVDADGATEIDDLLKLLRVMNDLLKDTTTLSTQSSKKKLAVVIGSRHQLEESSTAERTIVRTILMYCFHFFVRHLCSQNVKDTQCGFKLFNRAASDQIFCNLHLNRWAFDIEIITIIEKLGIPFQEVSVNWTEVDGSKLDTSKMALAMNSISMLRDMVFVKLCYTFGVWKINDNRKIE